MTKPPTRPDLRTRLRELRKARGWTLAQVAEKLGTTAQTVSRLETNVMTVSTDWLQKFADLFGVSVADLIAETAQSAIDVIGHAAADGSIGPQTPFPLPVRLAVEDAVAIKLNANIGPYREGSFVVATKLNGRNISTAIGHPCICETDRGALWFARVVEGIDERVTLVPLERGDVQYDVALNWAARVKLDLKLAD